MHGRNTRLSKLLLRDSLLIYERPWLLSGNRWGRSSEHHLRQSVVLWLRLRHHGRLHDLRLHHRRVRMRHWCCPALAYPSITSLAAQHLTSIAERASTLASIAQGRHLLDHRTLLIDGKTTSLAATMPTVHVLKDLAPQQKGRHHLQRNLRRGRWRLIAVSD